MLYNHSVAYHEFWTPEDRHIRLWVMCFDLSTLVSQRNCGLARGSWGLPLSVSLHRRSYRELVLRPKNSPRKRKKHSVYLIKGDGDSGIYICIKAGWILLVKVVMRETLTG